MSPTFEIELVCERLQDGEVDEALGRDGDDAQLHQHGLLFAPRVEAVAERALHEATETKKTF